MKSSIIVLAGLALILTFGCKNESTTTSSSAAPDTEASSTVAQTSMSPEELGELGAQIKKSPNDAQKILSDHNLSEQSFEQQVRQVAQDPAASKRYAAAYKKAGA
jgi:hypothetical protein